MAPVKQTWTKTQSFVLSYYYRSYSCFIVCIVQPRLMNSSRPTRKLSPTSSLADVCVDHMAYCYQRCCYRQVQDFFFHASKRTGTAQFESLVSRHSSPHGAARAAQPATALLGAHILPCLLHHLLHQLKTDTKASEPWHEVLRSLVLTKHVDCCTGI